jgi:hypothetical protein
MTRQETFKRRIRQRMENTGERYGAARRALVEKSEIQDRREWVSEPEMAEDTLREATVRGWDEWCDIIDGWPGTAEGHTAIATFLRTMMWRGGGPRPSPSDMSGSPGCGSPTNSPTGRSARANHAR